MRSGSPKKKPLCFVLPSAVKENLQELHRIYSSQVVRKRDVLLNVFPKHQAEIAAYNYPAEIETILDPSMFLRRLCGCRAVISSRLHGAIFGLHSGVPTLAAWPAGEGTKVPMLMNDVVRLPEQFILVNDSLTRSVVDIRVAEVRMAYGAGKGGGKRRETLFKRLHQIFRRTQDETQFMLTSVFLLGSNGWGRGEAGRHSKGATKTNNYWMHPAKKPRKKAPEELKVGDASSHTVTIGFVVSDKHDQDIPVEVAAPNETTVAVVMASAGEIKEKRDAENGEVSTVSAGASAPGHTNSGGKRDPLTRNAGETRREGERAKLWDSKDGRGGSKGIIESADGRGSAGAGQGSKRASQGSNRVSGVGARERDSERASERYSAVVSDKASGGAYERVSGGAKEKVSGGASEGDKEGASDRASEERTRPTHSNEEKGEGSMAAPTEGGNRKGHGEGREYAAKENPNVPQTTTPWNRWWDAGGATAAPRPMVGREVSSGGSLVVTLGTLVLIAVLGMPGLSSLVKSDTSCHRTFSPNELVATPHREGSGGGSDVGVDIPRRLYFSRPRLQVAIFFGVNYILWVILAVGFNICSKTYLRETRNPVALLAIQGWVGVAVLSALNALARRHRSSRHVLPSSPRGAWSSPAWVGHGGLRQLKGVSRNIWQAGLLHCGNAVLTSWSVLVGGIAATHALKALEPVAAAGFSRLLLGSTLPPRRVAAVGVIVLGLGILMLPSHRPVWAGGWGETKKDSHLVVSDGDGLELVIPAIMTACACCAVALRNVFLKGADPRPPPPLSLLVCSVVAAVVGSISMLMPWLPFSWEWAEKPLLLASGLNASLCFVGYNLASFNLLSELSPVGHAVGNASKRVCLFATGLLLVEEGSMSARQLAGASVALVGLASYNLAAVASTSTIS